MAFGQKKIWSKLGSHCFSDEFREFMVKSCSWEKCACPKRVRSSKKFKYMQNERVLQKKILNQESLFYCKPSGAIQNAPEHQK